jgi:hypothetical protein
MPVYASGGNYQIDLVKGIVVCRVWKRPEITREEGARFAEEKVEILTRLAEGPRAMAKALLFDLRQAPASWGPITQAALDKIFVAWEVAGRRLGVLLADEPLQMMLIKQSFKQTAPTFGQIFTVELEAEIYCTGRSLQP